MNKQQEWRRSDHGLAVPDGDGGWITIEVPEWLVDAILRDRELADYVAEKHGTLLHLKADEDQVAFAQQQDQSRIAELEAEQKRTQEWLERFQGTAADQGLKAMTAETDAARAWELVREISTALQELVNEQNGPPLVRHEESWQLAMNNAADALARAETAMKERS